MEEEQGRSHTTNQKLRQRRKKSTTLNPNVGGRREYDRELQDDARVHKQGKVRKKYV